MSHVLLEEKLPELLSKAENLPSLPAVALEVLSLARDENAGMEDMAAVIARDPALVAKLLKLANSPLFNCGREIRDVHQATVMLGLRTLQLMSLSFSLTSTLPRQGAIGGFRLPDYWRRGLLLAVAGRSVAETVQRPELAGEAFVCGMLGNIGQLVLARCLPELYAPVLAEAGAGWPTSALEQRLLGFHNRDVAYVLLGKWGLPRSIGEAVLCMSGGTELAGIEPASPHLVEVMQLARLAVDVLCNEDHGTPLIELYRRTKPHGVAPRDITRLLTGLERDLAEMASTMEIALPTGRGHVEILEEARHQILSLSLNTASSLNTVSRKATELMRENESLLARALIDKLTGLANRAGFDAALERAQARDTATREALGLLVLDIDRFKDLNDTHGHPAGDAVIAAVGRLLLTLVRSRDTAARYGGEEFAVVIPGGTQGILAVVGERIRAAIEGLEVPWGEQRLKITMSVGGAAMPVPPDGGVAAELLRRADRELYRAKGAGRNKVCLADVEP